MARGAEKRHGARLRLERSGTQYAEVYRQVFRD
jgi:hypothetical protein